MPSFSVELIHTWHDFFVFMGTASATLIGAMFVVASIGGGFLTRDRSPEIRAFLTPTVIHLATVLLGCALMLVPGLEAPKVAERLRREGPGSSLRRDRALEQFLHPQHHVPLRVVTEHWNSWRRD